MSTTRQIERWAPLMLAVFALWVVYPFWTNGVPRGHDMPGHISMAKGLKDGIVNEGIIRRWDPEACGGLGAAALSQYPLGSVVLNVATSFPDGEITPRSLGRSVTLSLLLMTVTSFVWLKQASGNNIGASLGAALYLLLPYNLSVNPLERNAIGEATAIAMAPIALWGVERICRNLPKGAAVLASGVGLTIFCHPAIGAAITIMVILQAAIAGKTYLGATIAGIALGFGCAASGILTHIWATPLSQFGAYTEGNVADVILGTIGAETPWPNEKWGRKIFILAMGQAALTLTLGPLALLKNPSPAAKACVVSAVGSLFMMTAWSLPLWENTPFRYMQLPMRWLGINGLALAGCLALGVKRQGKNPLVGQLADQLIPAETFLTIVAIVACAYNWALNQEKIKPVPGRAPRWEKTEYKGANRMSPKEHLPKDAAPNWAETMKSMPPKTIKGDGPETKILLWEPAGRGIHLKTEEWKSEGKITIGHHPWLLFEATDEAGLQLEWKPENSLIAVKIPKAFEGGIWIKLQRSAGEIAGWYISTGACILTLLLLLKPKKTLAGKIL